MWCVEFRESAGGDAEGSMAEPPALLGALSELEWSVEAPAEWVCAGCSDRGGKYSSVVFVRPLALRFGSACGVGVASASIVVEGETEPDEGPESVDAGNVSVAGVGRPESDPPASRPRRCGGKGEGRGDGKARDIGARPRGCVGAARGSEDV